MGIRFQCQNGHTLHVKSFLAGKRGICPKCGVKFLIPNDLKRDTSSAQDSAIQIATTDSAASVGSAEAAPTRRREIQNGPPDPPPVPPAELPRGTRSNPIDEAPRAVWYVRPPTGEQYGPASGDVLRVWISEGRVTPNCHVWCEGWDDWRSADVLLGPEQAGTQGAPTITPPEVASPPTPADGLRIDTVGRPNMRTKQRKRALMLVCILLVVCLVLLILLINLLQ